LRPKNKNPLIIINEKCKTCNTEIEITNLRSPDKMTKTTGVPVRTRRSNLGLGLEEAIWVVSISWIVRKVH
jgi:hypothetical protein